MTPEPLRSPYIGISLYQDDYSKVKGLLPAPSFIDTLHSYYHQKITLIYSIEGYITSSNQFRWISNIKLGLQKFLFVPFDFEEEFYITNTTEVTNSIYTIDELSKAFKVPLITYPKIMYPLTKKEIYQRLCWYGKRLIHQKCFTKEAMISAALLMNKKLTDKYQDKDLHRKVLGAYMFINENREKFSIRLNEQQLKQAHSKGGQARKAQRVQSTKEKIEKLLATGNYTKPNGKVNLSSLAKAVNRTRQTVANYV